MKTNLNSEQINFIKTSVEKDASLSLDDLANQLSQQYNSPVALSNPEAQQAGDDLAFKVYDEYKDKTLKQIDFAKEIIAFLPQLEMNEISKPNLMKVIKYLETDLFLSDAIYTKTVKEMDALINNLVREMFISQGLSLEELNNIPKQDIEQIVETSKAKAITASPEIQNILKELNNNNKITQEILDILKPILAQSR